MPIFSCFVKEIFSSSLYKKSDKLLEQNFLEEQINNFLSKLLLDSQDVVRLKIFKV